MGGVTVKENTVNSGQRVKFTRRSPDRENS